MTNKVRFGHCIRKLRNKNHLSLRKAASELNINFSYLSKIETGNLPPPSEKLTIKLAEFYNVNHFDLLNISGKIPEVTLKKVRREALQKFGSQLRKLRENAGVSLTELASMAKIDPSYISKIENSIKPPPSKKVVIKIAFVLKYNQDELLALAGRK